MGSPATSGGSVFTYPNQSGAADAIGNLFGSMYGTAMSGQTPGAWAYPQAQSLYPGAYNSAAQYLTGDIIGGQPTAFDTLSGNAVGAAQNAYNSYIPMMWGGYNSLPTMMGSANSLYGYMPQVGANAFDPMYTTMVNAAADNPQYAQALTGAAQAAAYGGTGAENMMNQANQIYLGGFDPRSALYNRGQQQLIDKSSAINAMSGLGSSPYGAGVTANALGNYGIDWQNQQQARQIQASQATSPLYSGATNLAYGSAQLPNQVYMKQIADVLSALNARNTAGVTGSGALGSLDAAGNAGLTSANNLLNSLTSSQAAFGAQPYLTGATIGNNSLAALANLQNQLTGATNLGNQQYTLPQMLIDDALRYLSGGQIASMNNLQGGQMGFNQTAQGIGGALGALGTIPRIISGFAGLPSS